MRGEPDPQWGRDAWRGFLHEWASYGRTALAVTTEPRRFMAAWAEGERAALNPLACMLNLFAVVTVANVIVMTVRHGSDDTPPLLELFAPALQLATSSLLASAVHFPLKLLGTRRRWRTTLAATLFVTSGPMLPFYVVRDTLFANVATMTKHQVLAMAVPMGAAFIGYLVLTLAAAHRLAWWRVLLAFVLGASVMAATMELLTRLHLVFWLNG